MAIMTHEILTLEVKMCIFVKFVFCYLQIFFKLCSDKNTFYVLKFKREHKAINCRMERDFRSSFLTFLVRRFVHNPQKIHYP